MSYKSDNKVHPRPPGKRVHNRSLLEGSKAKLGQRTGRARAEALREVRRQEKVLPASESEPYPNGSVEQRRLGMLTRVHRVPIVCNGEKMRRWGSAALSGVVADGRVRGRISRVRSNTRVAPHAYAVRDPADGDKYFVPEWEATYVACVLVLGDEGWVAQCKVELNGGTPK